jgi:Flp pilus assembly protein TadB
MGGSLGVILGNSIAQILILGTMFGFMIWDRSKTKRERDKATIDGRAFHEELANIKAEMRENREKFIAQMAQIKRKSIEGE